MDDEKLTVWVFEKGYDYEGSDIQSVHRTYEGATTAVEQFIAADDSYGYTFDGRNRWTAGARYLTVWSYEVQR